MTDSTRIIGSLRAENGKGVVHLEDDFDTDIDDLWSALTDLARVARWIGEVEGEARLGGEISARFTSGWDGQLRVDACEAPDRLLLTSSPGTDDETIMEARLTSDGATTHLIIEERGLPLAEVAAHGAGWQAHVEDLAAYLTSSARVAWEVRWRELTPPYDVMASSLR